MTRLQRGAGVFLAAYLVFLAFAFFSPSSDRQSAGVLWVQDVLEAAGLQGPWDTYHRLEVLMNVVIVVPVAFVASLVLPRFSWRDWTALGFLLAVGIEAAQALVLPNREASFSDIVANTAGALAGALLFRLVRPLLRTRTSV